MQDKILEILRGAKGCVSGSCISEQLGVSRQAVWKAIDRLKEQGYEFESIRNKGYRLVKAPDFLCESELRARLKTKIIGKNLVVLDSTQSTNDYLKQLASNGAQNGTVAAAREQTRGKGRLGRRWLSEKDEAIAFSVLLRPNILPSQVQAITPLAGLAVCRALREFTLADCKIKWPNDIIVGKKKLVGILTEMSAELDRVQYVVIGIGINCDNARFDSEISHKATSLLLETGRHFDKNELLARIIEELELIFTQTQLELNTAVIKEYKSLCATLGRGVTFTRGSRRVSGQAMGISPQGELRVMMSDGTISDVGSGEVTVQGIY